MSAASEAATAVAGGPDGASSGAAASPPVSPPRAVNRQTVPSCAPPGAGLGLEAVAQRLHRRRADAADLVELVDRGEPAVLVAELR